MGTAAYRKCFTMLDVRFSSFYSNFTADTTKILMTKNIVLKKFYKKVPIKFCRRCHISGPKPPRKPLRTFYERFISFSSKTITGTIKVLMTENVVLTKNYKKVPVKFCRRCRISCLTAPKNVFSNVSRALT